MKKFIVTAEVYIDDEYWENHFQKSQPYLQNTIKHVLDDYATDTSDWEREEYDKDDDFEAIYFDNCKVT